MNAHEHTDPADFTKERFATRPDGKFAARLVTGTHPELYPWRCSDIPGRSDRAMAEDGFTPMQECPDPEAHGPVDYKVLLEQAERERAEAAEALDTTMGRAIKAERERDDARATKDMHKARADEERARADEARFDSHAAIARAERAEQERDQAKDLARSWMKTSEEWEATAEEWEAFAEKAERERSEAREANRKWHDRCSAAERERDHWKREADGANADLADLRSAEPRPLTPDAITDETAAKVAKALGDLGHGWVPSHYMHDALVLALTEPPARPEWAGLREALDWLWPDGTDGIAREDIARRLHTEAGVRAPEDGAR